MYKYLVLIIFFLQGILYAQTTTLQESETYLQQGDLEKAKILLEKNVSANPRDEASLALLGDIAGFQKQWDEAISYYKELLDLKPKDPNYNFKYGGALGMKALSVSRFQAALLLPDLKKYLEKAAQLDKNHVKTRRALVELYIQLPGILGGSVDKAKQFSQELQNIDPMQASLARAYIYRHNDKEAEAQNAYSTALNLYRKSHAGNKDNNLNYEMGKIAAEYKMELNYGYNLLENYLANYSYKDIYTPEWVYYRQAQIKAHLNNKEAALTLVEKALSLNPEFKEARQEKKRILAMQ